MTDCEYIQGCPMFQKFTLDANKQFWIRTYCKTEGGEGCARKALRKQGKRAEEVPEDLLPNGKHMK